MAEYPLDDRAAGVHPGIVPLGATELIVEQAQGPSVQAAFHDTEGRVEGLDERIRVEHMLEVVVPRAVISGVRERRRLGAGLTGEVAQPEHTLAGGMATVAQSGQRAGDGVIASCSSVIAATTSRRRRLYWGHML